MGLFLKKAGTDFGFLPVLLFILFSLVTPPLPARGSGEFSKGYMDELRNLFEEVVFKIDIGEMNGAEAKTSLAVLRSQYRVEYNDFAGKIDAVIDEVEEGEKNPKDAVIDFEMIQNDLIKGRERILNAAQDEASMKDQNGHQAGSGGGAITPSKGSSSADMDGNSRKKR